MAGRGARAAVSAARLMLETGVTAAAAGGLVWLVSLYGQSLRDPRFLDGWLLAGGMGFQLVFHVAVKARRLAPQTAARWRRLHILTGCALIALVLSHCDVSLPDTDLEWALGLAFVLITLSGLAGAYLAWLLAGKRGLDELAGAGQIAVRRADLAQKVAAIVSADRAAAETLPLPVPPHDDWIADLYNAHLRDFFAGPRNGLEHLVGSERAAARLTGEIDALSRYVDAAGQEKLSALKGLVIEKDRLDLARVYLALNRGWLWVHVPLTYALVVLSVLHVLTVYAFSSGAW